MHDALILTSALKQYQKFYLIRKQEAVELEREVNPFGDLQGLFPWKDSLCDEQID